MELKAHSAHRNSPLTPEGPRRLIDRCRTRPISHVAAEMGVSHATASKWVNRYKKFGELGLMDRSSTPARQPTATAAGIVKRIEAMRREHKWSASRIVFELDSEGVRTSRRTVSRLLLQLGLNRRQFIDPNGKSDQLDSEQAARAVLAGTATAVPKSKSGPVEAIRVLRITRSTAVKARTQAMNALQSIIVTAPDTLRKELIALRARTLITRCSRLRPETSQPITLASEPERMLMAATKTSLRELAIRWQTLDTEIKHLTAQIGALVAHAAPELTALHGVGTEIAGQLLITAGDNPERLTSEAAFAKLCGVAPQPASSGRTTGRHRLSRGGDRAANSALYLIAITRMRRHEPTRAYLARRTSEGLGKREILRCLKRFIAREVFAALPRPATVEELAPAA